MFINNFDPVAFQLLSIEIRWYSLAYIFGILFGWLYCKKFLINDNEEKKTFDDFISYLIIGIIVGGRIGYVLIYNFNYYINNLFEVLKIWNGGMSFHGALIGIIIATYIFCKKYKRQTLLYLDYIALTSPIGIFLGRTTNFLNSELYGRETEILWSVKFIKVDNLNRHPSQLYEALFEGLILFFILKIIYKKFSNLNGLTSSMFLILYSLFRFFIEFTREPDSHIGFIFLSMSIGQIISIFTLSCGIILFLKLNEFRK